MAKAMKLKDENYWDSSSIEHNREKLSILLEKLKGTVLWTNQNYTTEFEAQKIEIDLKNCNYIRVIYTDWGGSWTHLDAGKIPKVLLGVLNPASNTSRRYSSDDSGVTFENPSNDGNKLSQVPIFIIGYKYW